MLHRSIAISGRVFARVPDVLVLSSIVGVAAAVWLSAGRSSTLPAVFGDELVYSGLGKSIARGHGSTIGGLGMHGYGLFYPLLISGAYALAGNGVDAFAWIKALNAIMMSLAAVPAFFLARRVVSRGWALGAATLTVAVPGMDYARLVMTEAAFYPAFLLCGLVLVRALERPTVSRQLLAVGTIVALITMRAQAIVLVAAYATSVCLYGVSTRSFRPTFRRHAWAWVGFGVVTIVALAVARGDPRAPFAAYGVLVRPYSPFGLLKWLVWSLTSLEFAVVVLPFVVFPVAVGHFLRREAGTAERAIGAVSLSMSVWMLISAVAISASPFGLDRLHERNLFYVIPLLLVAFVWWVRTGASRFTRAIAVSAVVATALPLLLPARLAQGDLFDAPAMFFWSDLARLLRPLPVPAAMSAVAVVVIAGLLLSRKALVPIAVLAVGFLLVVADETSHRPPLTPSEASRLAWVDAALPRSAHVTILYVDFPARGCGRVPAAGWQRALALWTEFFNLDVDTVIHVFGDNRARGLRSTDAFLHGDGSLTVNGKQLSPRYVVTDARVRLVGRRLARLDPTALGLTVNSEANSLTLWGVRAPLKVTSASALAAARRQTAACA